MQDVLDRHQKIALQFSGGRDSLACLYLLKDHWDRLTVYWLNTGAAFPETASLMGKVRAMVPSFVEIIGNQPGVTATFGIPSDIVPVSSTPIGLAVAPTDKPMIQDRYSCCARTMMQPTHARMIEDGITLVIRGQKNADNLKSPVRSGHVEDGIEYLFPIEDWTRAQVTQFLREQNVDLPRFYEMLESAPDCMTCTAYWEDGASRYLKRYHHAQYLDNQAKLQAINEAVSDHIAAFNQEIAP